MDETNEVPSNMEWQDACEQVSPHVVRITTPEGSGTGFLLRQGQHQDFSAIATAAHVVSHAHFWEQPIRIEHHTTGKVVMLRPAERVIYIDEDRDTAGILLTKGLLPLPQAPLFLAPEGKYVRLGNEIAWLGFPAVAPRNLCFFTGRVSAFLEQQSTYLVDGVAINGVSGGPAFFLAGPAAALVGLVSAYIANRATGDTLPGLAVIRDLSSLYDWLKTLASFDQAKTEETKLPEPPPPTPESAV